MAEKAVFLSVVPDRHLDAVAALEANSYPEDEAVSDGNAMCMYSVFFDSVVSLSLMILQRNLLSRP